MIEFTQLHYLIAIVDNDYNLTRSAKMLHVTQPALSKSISELEFRQDVKIFNRKKGRIIGLTTIGNKLMKDARKVYGDYIGMMDRLQTSASDDQGTVRIGIAPVIISTVFSDAIVQFIQENPGIHLELVEKGAYELQEMLVLGKIDLAVIVSPSTFNTINEKIIYRNSVSVWFNKQHRFHKKSGSISIQEISKEKIVTLSNGFMVTYQLKQQFNRAGLYPNFFFQTGAWDLLLNMCQNNDLIGILATPIENNYDLRDMEHREIDPFFPWNISICDVSDSQKSPVVKKTEKWFISYFL